MVKAARIKYSSIIVKLLVHDRQATQASFTAGLFSEPGQPYSARLHKQACTPTPMMHYI